MTEISSTDAALGGFPLARSNPRTILIWGLVSFVSSLLTFTLMTAFSGAAFAQAQTLGASADIQPAEILEMYRQMAPGYAASIVVSIVVSGLLNASAARLVLNPSDKRGLGYVQFGADELRQMLLALVLNLIFIGTWVAVGLLAAAAYFVGGAALSALVGLLGFLAVAVLNVMLVVRLSLSSPATFVNQRLALRESWQMTKGRFWTLVGTFLLAGVLGMLVVLLVWGISMVVVTLLFGMAAAGGAMSPTFESVAGVFAPANLIYLAILSFGSALGYLIFLTPAPTIYKQLTGAPAVFD